MNNIPFIGEYDIFTIQELNSNLHFSYEKNNTLIYKNINEPMFIKTKDVLSGDKQWMASSSECGIELFSSYELAYGHCVVGGLGFSLLANALIEKPEVDSVTVYEINKEVIDFNITAKLVNQKIKIINKPIEEIDNNQKIDCLLLDHVFDTQDFNEMIKVYKYFDEKCECNLLWFWPAEVLFEDWVANSDTETHKHINIIFHDDNKKQELFQILENKYLYWKEHLGIKSLPDLTGEQLHRFIKNWHHYFVTIK